MESTVSTEEFEIVQQVINPAGLVSSLDIKPDEFLLPLEEAVVNAIQSIEDSENADSGQIIIRVKRGIQIKLEIEGGEDQYTPITGFVVEDNGAGFTSDRLAAFSQPYTNYNVKKGGKGMGRYTVLACFGNLSIDSTFKEADSFISRKLRFDVKDGLKKYPDADSVSSKSGTNRTLVSLNNYLSDYYNEIIHRRVSIVILPNPCTKGRFS